jgi:hypothetical protein
MNFVDTHPPIYSFTKSAVPDMVQRRCDPVRPNKFVNVEVLLVGYRLIIFEAMFNYQHLHEPVSIAARH